MCSEASVNSPGNPRSSPEEKKKAIRLERFAEKEGFKTEMNE